MFRTFKPLISDSGSYITTNRFARALGRPFATLIQVPKVTFATVKEGKLEVLATENLDHLKVPDLTAHELLAVALPEMKKENPGVQQASSATNKPYENIVFTFTHQHDESDRVAGILKRGNLALDYLVKHKFKWSDVEYVAVAKKESDVSDRNETALFPLMLEIANSLCPETHAIAHFTEQAKPTGRIDHLFTIHRLISSLNASQLEDSDPDKLFEIPKLHKWTILGQEDSDIQVLVGVEDKYKMDPVIWKDSADKKEKLALLPKQVANYGGQMLKYMRLFAHQYIIINDANAYLSFFVNRQNLTALCNAPDTNHLPLEVSAEYVQYGSANVRKGIYFTFFAALEEKFGKFDGEKWEKGGKPRGPISLTKKVAKE